MRDTTTTDETTDATDLLAVALDLDLDLALMAVLLWEAAGVLDVPHHTAASSAVLDGLNQ